MTFSAGELHSCGVRAEGTVECWGAEAFGQAPARFFAAVSTDAWDSCGVRTDGTVACWGFLSDS